MMDCETLFQCSFVLVVLLGHWDLCLRIYRDVFFFNGILYELFKRRKLLFHKFNFTILIELLSFMNTRSSLIAYVTFHVE